MVKAGTNMAHFKEQIIEYVNGIDIRFKRWRDCDISTLAYQIRIFSGMGQEEAGKLDLKQEEKDWFIKNDKKIGHYF